jgi:hypothetical protein
MQAEKYIGQAFSYTGVFDVIKVITTKDTTVFYVKTGEFLDKTWGNDHPQIKEFDGIKFLAINKTNFRFIRKLTSLEEELY